MSCYSEIQINFCERGLLEDCLDGAYLLTMVGGQRDWRKEYAKALPYSSVCVQYNQGFRTCPKPQLYQQDSTSDLADALGNVFRMALQRDQRTILVLEDDFMFDWTADDARSITEFINSKTMDVYSLGAVPIFGLPTTGDHIRVVHMGLSHGIIYCNPQYMRDYIAALDQRTTRLVTDVFWWPWRYVKYHFHRPVCTQLLVDTENSKLWNNRFARCFIQHWSLDTERLGFQKAFSFSYKGILWIIGSLMLLLVISVFFFILKRMKKKIAV